MRSQSSGRGGYPLVQKTKCRRKCKKPKSTTCSTSYYISKLARDLGCRTASVRRGVWMSWNLLCVLVPVHEIFGPGSPPRQHTPLLTCDEHRCKNQTTATMQPQQVEEKQQKNRTTRVLTRKGKRTQSNKNWAKVTQEKIKNDEEGRWLKKK